MAVFQLVAVLASHQPHSPLIDMGVVPDDAPPPLDSDPDEELPMALFSSGKPAPTSSGVLAETSSIS
jgi:hypothetical protein